MPQVTFGTARAALTCVKESCIFLISEAVSSVRPESSSPQATECAGKGFSGTKALMSQQNIGRYEIISELGRGAMGLVYKAKDPTIGRIVALKTMRLDVHGLEADEMLRRFRHEAQAVGVLNHPNIVTIYDAAEQDKIFYIAMEVIEGTTLHQLLTQKPGLSTGEINRLS